MPNHFLSFKHCMALSPLLKFPHLLNHLSFFTGDEESYDSPRVIRFSAPQQDRIA